MSEMDLHFFCYCQLRHFPWGRHADGKANICGSGLEFQWASEQGRKLFWQCARVSDAAQRESRSGAECAAAADIAFASQCGRDLTQKIAFGSNYVKAR